MLTQVWRIACLLNTRTAGDVVILIVDTLERFAIQGGQFRIPLITETREGFDLVRKLCIAIVRVLKLPLDFSQSCCCLIRLSGLQSSLTKALSHHLPGLLVG